MPDFITIENDGPEIISTNYWTTPHAQRGYYHLSINAGAFRLLVPDSQLRNIEEWRSAREVIISRGPWPGAGKSDALEILFEDDTDNPYAIHLVVEQVDRLPLPTDMDVPGQPHRWQFSVWTKSGKTLQLPARYRIVAKIPHLRSWN
jgi:hypothetical protein